MNTPAHNIELVCSEYTRLTGRQARVQLYEHAIFDFLRLFTVEDFTTVLTWLLKQNRKNNFQYNIQLGSLLNDHMRFDGHLQEARARLRIKPQTAQDKALAQLRPVVCENTTSTNTTPAGQTAVIAALQKHA